MYLAHTITVPHVCSLIFYSNAHYLTFNCSLMFKCDAQVVLLVAHTDRAVNHLLSRLLDHQKLFDMTIIFFPTRVSIHLRY